VWLGALALASSTAAAVDAAGVAALPPKTQQVVFLGDSITYSGGYVRDVAAYFATRHPGHRLSFLNLGLPSETVSGLSEEGHAGGKFPRPDLHERLTRVLTQSKPDLVFACYGMNDGIYLPLAEDRFAKFRDGMQRLHHQVTATGARLIHVTPAPYDELKGGRAGYAPVLDRYSEWLLDQRGGARWEVVDAHFPMQQALEAGRRENPNFFFARDGIHPNDAGHWQIAREILRYLGARDIAGLPDAAAMMATHPRGSDILKLVTTQQTLLKDAWLGATKHTRPGMKAGLPLTEAKAQSAQIQRKIDGLR
jgi:lysophospholipase L1-like esterase